MDQLNYVEKEYRMQMAATVWVNVGPVLWCLLTTIVAITGSPAFWPMVFAGACLVLAMVCFALVAIFLVLRDLVFMIINAWTW